MKIYKVGQAVERISSRRKVDYNSRLEEIKSAERNEVSILLEKLSVGDLKENIRKYKI